MAPYSLDELRSAVSKAVVAYNARAREEERIARVSLFGSYAEGRASQASDVDLLVSFESAIVSLITLAKVLSSMEEQLGLSVDVVQDPPPDGSLLQVTKVVPLYERA
ncbi:nucleotidyltransferase family protein [Adlercreutzia sp. ZJ473]|uniref:nucleotidyltransferase family protein n=1 Tax=Adlercreutzia sp. ZJ473 TaxID=2722822 RepID=UPI001556D018|nr:nucleotidyltransferase domain-containing protein [Adlercreutzia sp. ZJ473]